MALPGVLSALRVLILDKPPLPPGFEARLGSFRKLFPELVTNELEDLAKISPERLQIYTYSIFSSQRGVLRNKFPITFALIRKSYNDIFERDFIAYDFIREQHASRPWKGNLVKDLVKNFCTFIKEDSPEIVEAIPGIIDVLRIEELSFYIVRAKDLGRSSKESLSLEQIAALTVEQLLELEFSVPALVAFERFDFDTPAYFNYFVSNKRELPDHPPEQERVFAVGARNKYLNPRWVSVAPEVFSYFKPLPRETNLALADFADYFISAQSGGREEPEVFKEFMRVVLDLARIGAIVLSPPEAP